MTEPSSEDTESGTEAGAGGEGSPEPPDNGLISDEQLPDDLNPAKNPLARDPGDEDDSDKSSGPGGPGEPKVEGMPDMGQPGMGA